MNRQIESSLKSIKNGFVDFVNDSRTYAITQDLYGEITGVLNELNALKLDSMFMNNSDEWRASFNPRELNKDQTDVLRLMDEAQAILYELKNNLNRRNIASLQQNQVRDLNYAARERLRGLVLSLHPYSYKSHLRADEYARSLGIRSRLKDIRNELSPDYVKEPLDKWTKWTDKNLIEAPKYNTPHWREYTYGQPHVNTESTRYENRSSLTNKNVGGLYFPDTPKFKHATMNSQLSSEANDYLISGNERPKTVSPAATANSTSTSSLSRPSSRIATSSSLEQQHPKGSTANINGGKDETWKKYAREAGLVVDYPAETTEYRSHYLPPPSRNLKNFTLNPQLDLHKLKRPFSEAVQFPKTTEYRTRYAFPDAERIDKFPWIKNLNF